MRRVILSRGRGLLAAGLLAASAAGCSSHVPGHGSYQGHTSRPGVGSPLTRLIGTLSWNQSLESFDCSSTGPVEVRLAEASNQFDGQFRTGVLTNEPGCPSQPVTGSWTGEDVNGDLTIDKCTVDGNEVEPGVAFMQGRLLDLSCKWTDTAGVLYELNLSDLSR